MRFKFAVILCLVASVTAMAQSSPPDAPLRARALRPGDTVMMVAPARRANRERVQLAKSRLEAMGFRVLLHRDLFQEHGYLAGSDAQRAGQLMDAFANRDVSAVLPVTGGFGTTRLLDRLDYDIIRANPKVLLGYSDITGLHLAIQRKTGLVTFHGPNLDSGLGVLRI